MSWALIAVIAVVATIIVVVPLAYLVLRSSSQGMQGGFRLVQDSVENLQRNLLLQQKEFERGADAKQSSLRLEIGEAIQGTRRDLQAGLLQTTQALEKKVADLTTSVQGKLETNLKEGFLHFEKVQTGLRQAEIQLQHLNSVGQSIHELNNLLKLPHLRGNFGEATLERLLQDLLPADGFELQYRIVPNSTERVDAIIRYPSTVLPIDSKFPREQVLPLFETNDPVKLEQARRDLIDVMKGLARGIKEKYIRPEHGTTDMALLFVPSETLYFEILRNVRLGEELAKHKVFAVSPNTLAIALRSISLSRSYYDMAKGVEKTIVDIKKAQQHLLNFEGRFTEIGTALTKAQTAYHTAGTHLSRYQGAVTRLAGAAETPVEAPPETPILPPSSGNA